MGRAVRSTPTSLPPPTLSLRLRYRGEWQEHLHQTDEDHPWDGLHRRGQEGLHQAGVPEHLHLHAGHDPGHGEPQDRVHIRAEQGGAAASGHGGPLRADVVVL